MTTRQRRNRQSKTTKRIRNKVAVGVLGAVLGGLFPASGLRRDARRRAQLELTCTDCSRGTGTRVAPSLHAWRTCRLRRTTWRAMLKARVVTPRARSPPRWVRHSGVTASDKARASVRPRRTNSSGNADPPATGAADATVRRAGGERRDHGLRLPRLSTS